MTNPGDDARESAERATAGSATERLSFFSDAVVAIAITLLAIELPVPEGDTAAEMLAHMNAQSFEYVAFLISFVVIGGHWVGHHRTFRYVERTDGGVVWLNLLWLLLVVLTPFLTKLISGQAGLNVLQFGLYAAAQTLQFVVMAAMIATIERRGWFAAVLPSTFARNGYLRTLVPAAGFLVSIPLFVVVHRAAYAAWVLVPVVFSVIRRVVEARRPSAVS